MEGRKSGNFYTEARLTGITEDLILANGIIKAPGRPYNKLEIGILVGLGKTDDRVPVEH